MKTILDVFAVIIVALLGVGTIGCIVLIVLKVPDQVVIACLVALSTWAVYRVTCFFISEP